MEMTAEGDTLSELASPVKMARVMAKPRTSQTFRTVRMPAKLRRNALLTCFTTG